jgi:hypothetical protein
MRSGGLLGASQQGVFCLARGGSRHSRRCCIRPVVRPPYVWVLAFSRRGNDHYLFPDLRSYDPACCGCLGRGNRRGCVVLWLPKTCNVSRGLSYIVER